METPMFYFFNFFDILSFILDILYIANIRNIMDKSNFIAISIFIILTIIVLMSHSHSYSQPEHFNTYLGYRKRYCQKCGWKNRWGCSKCNNCGYCVNRNGVGECVPGDAQGPYFRSDCLYWDYGDPYFSQNVGSVFDYRNIYPNIRYYPTSFFGDYYRHSEYPYSWRRRRMRWNNRPRLRNKRIRNRRIRNKN